MQVDDHIGAVAYSHETKQIYGANWDTKKIYVWSHDGVQRQRLNQQDWSPAAPDWGLAVQDWKAVSSVGFLSDAGPLLLASGIDKSKLPATPRSVFEVYRLDPRQRLLSVRLPDHQGIRVATEGMCLYKEFLVLLPTDIGHNARLYF